MDDLIFFGWQRAGGAVHGAANAGRMKGTVTLDARAVETGAHQSADVDFEFYGPRDVAGFLAGAVTATSPAAGAQSAEETMCAFVELGAPDLPWRYAPAPHDAVQVSKWAPWIALVVGPTSDVVPAPGGRVAISRAVLQKHVLADAAKWAHVQKTNPPAPALPHIVSVPSRIARLPAMYWWVLLSPAYEAKEPRSPTLL